MQVLFSPRLIDLGKAFSCFNALMLVVSRLSFQLLPCPSYLPNLPHPKPFYFIAESI